MTSKRFFDTDSMYFMDSIGLFWTLLSVPEFM